MISQNRALDATELRVNTGQSKKGKRRTQVLLWSGGSKKGANVPLSWMIDVGAFQVRGVRPPSVPSCDYLIRQRRKGVRWTRNDRSRRVQARRDRGVDSMLPNHKRDRVGYRSFLGTSPNRYILKTRSRPVLFLLSSLSHEASPCRTTYGCPGIARRSRWMADPRLKKKKTHARTPRG